MTCFYPMCMWRRNDPTHGEDLDVVMMLVHSMYSPFIELKKLRERDARPPCVYYSIILFTICICSSVLLHCIDGSLHVCASLILILTAL